MKIQVNSDRTIHVDASLMRFVKEKSTGALDRFTKGITRLEIHLSDIDNEKTGRPDKRCLVEVRPAGEKPLVASAIAKTTDAAIDTALRKMKRSLTTFFGKRGRPAAKITAPVAKATKTTVTTKKVVAKQAEEREEATKKPAKLSPRGPKKKGVYQARRKSWPR